MSQIQPVILCGGSGTRLWPLSREHFPKQFISLMGQASLFQQTQQRLEGLINIQPAMIVGNEAHRFLVQEQLRQIQSQADVLILEPEGRNTAPALTLAAFYASQGDPQSLLLVMPSDHVMLRPQGLKQVLPQATLLAETGKIVTFGIAPEHPETGYGYIQAEGSEVLAFKEKPDQATAEAYLESGKYWWNAGIFLCRADVWLAEVQAHAPEIYSACQTAIAEGSRDGLFFRPQSEAFQQASARSIDYAVMEKTQLVAMVPLDAGWSDLGAWSALQNMGEGDSNGNLIEGDVIVHDSKNNYIKSTSRLVSVLGVENLIVIETPDAILVTHQDQAQNVRQIVDILRADARSEAEHHLRVARPWGFYETVDLGERFQVKRITVYPGQALSLQMHHHRSEHWIVVKGTAKVTRDDKQFLLGENESTYIPLGTVHRLENPGAIDLELIEIQSGAYLGEDDIVRYEDRYQRA